MFSIAEPTTVRSDARSGNGTRLRSTSPLWLKRPETGKLIPYHNCRIFNGVLRPFGVSILVPMALLLGLSASAQELLPAHLDADHAQHNAVIPVMVPKEDRPTYFQYKILPNGEIDTKSYAAAKARFVAKDPEQYEAMLRKNGPARIGIPRSEYITLPAEKRSEVDGRPDLYEIMEDQ